MYNGKYYPKYLSGSGYVMTRSVAKCLYNATLMLPFLHLEDVLITGNNLITMFSKHHWIFKKLLSYFLGFGAEACNIKRRGHKGFKPIGLNLKSIKKTDITMHYKDIKGKMEIYKSGKLKFDI